MQNNTANAYHEASILTADPGKLIILCYEKAIHHLILAVRHYENHEYEAKAKNLQKTLDIISELNSCLDMQKGGDIARNLDGLYRYMTARLIDADLKQNLDVFRQVIHTLKELHEAWKAVVVRQQATPAPVRIVPSSFPLPQPAMTSAGIGRTWSA